MIIFMLRHVDISLFNLTFSIDHLFIYFIVGGFILNLIITLSM